MDRVSEWGQCTLINMLECFLLVSGQHSTSRIFARSLAALASMLPGSRWSGRPRAGFDPVDRQQCFVVPSWRSVHQLFEDPLEVGEARATESAGLIGFDNRLLRKRSAQNYDRHNLSNFCLRLGRHSTARCRRMLAGSELRDSNSRHRKTRNRRPTVISLPTKPPKR
jgi:hypothetical protein